MALTVFTTTKGAPKKINITFQGQIGMDTTDRTKLYWKISFSVNGGEYTEAAVDGPFSDYDTAKTSLEKAINKVSQDAEKMATGRVLNKYKITNL